MQIYEMEVLAEANAVLTISNSSVTDQLSHMTVTMNDMQAQLKMLSLAYTKKTRSRRKYYCWSCRRSYTHGSKNSSSKKAGHNEEAYYKKRLGRSEKGCKWWLDAITNKIQISNPKIFLMNFIGTPPDSPINNILSIAESGTNIHPEKLDTTTMDPVIIWNEMTARLLYGSTMESSHIVTLQIPGLSKQARHIYISQKWKQSQ